MLSFGNEVCTQMVWKDNRLASGQMSGILSQTLCRFFFVQENLLSPYPIIPSFDDLDKEALGKHGGTGKKC